MFHIAAMFAIRKANGMHLADEFGEPIRFATEREAAPWCGRGERIEPIAPLPAPPPQPTRPAVPRFDVIGSDDVPAWQRARERRRG